MKRSLFTVLIILLAGCNSWERTTFQTLSASKATLDNAHAQYEARAIPQTKCAYALINNGNAAQAVAVNGFLDYKKVKDAKGDVAGQEAIVTGELASLAGLVVQVEALVSNPASSCGGQ